MEKFGLRPIAFESSRTGQLPWTCLRNTVINQSAASRRVSQRKPAVAPLYMEVNNTRRDLLPLNHRFNRKSVCARLRYGAPQDHSRLG